MQTNFALTLSYLHHLQLGLNNPAPPVVIKESKESIKPMVSKITANKMIKKICPPYRKTDRKN